MLPPQRQARQDVILMPMLSKTETAARAFWDGGIKVWIGDAMNGHRLATMFNRGEYGPGGGTGWSTRPRGYGSPGTSGTAGRHLNRSASVQA